MKWSIFRNLLFLCIFFNFNTNATNGCGSCKSLNADPTKTIFKNDIESQVLQGIKEEFAKKEVIFEIPKKMESEFNAKKQAIVDELSKKMITLKSDYILKVDAENLINQAFQYFIDRVKYYQTFTWVQTILANIKKRDPKNGNSSSIKVPASLKKLASNPPYLKTKTVFDR
jgi:hypothetical protein